MTGGGVIHLLRYDDFGGFTSSSVEEAIFEAVCAADYRLTVAVVPFYVDVQRLASNSTTDLVPLSADKIKLLASFLSTGAFDIALHGFAHLAVAPQRGLAEFSDSVPDPIQRGLIERGRRELEDRFQRGVNIFVPPWNNAGRSTCSLVSSMGMRLVGADATLSGAVAGGVGCVPYDATVTGTSRALASAKRAPGAIVGTTLHDYDFTGVARGEGLTEGSLRTMLMEWKGTASAVVAPDDAFQPARSEANLTYRDRLLTSRLPRRFTQTRRDVFWPATAITRESRAPR